MITTFPDKIREKIMKKVEESAAVLEQLPGVAVINDIRDGTVIYMNKKGLQVLGTTMEELQSLGAEYHQRYFNQEQAEEYVPLVLDMMQRANPDETCTFFQQVRFADEPDWQWHLTGMRIFVQDDEGKPVAILCVAQHLAAEHHYTRKVARLIDELSFIKNNMKTFESLTKREREILNLMGQGKSSTEIAEKLHISEHTVNTHRKNVRQKLNIQSNEDLQQFARAFDLM